MESNSEYQNQLRLLAAAVYEIRVLLAPYAGQDSDVRLAERLAYALHNDALAVLEGDGTFDIAKARNKIVSAEQQAKGSFGDGHKELLPQVNRQ